MFYALRDIAIGEEITQCYGNLSGDGRMNRIENLIESWGFTCNCLRCQVETRDGGGGGGGEDGGVVSAAAEERSLLTTFDEEHVCACGGVMVSLGRRGKREGNCQCNSVNLRFY